MIWFVVGLVGFLGIHSLSIVSRETRDKLVKRLGEGAYKGIYSLISLTTFALLVIGYGQARLQPVIIYVAPAWTRHLVWLLMLPVFPLLVSVYAKGKISSLARHPMLVAVKIWALAHLIANGMLIDLLLFGGFLAWAVADRIAIKRRAGAPTIDKRGWGLGDALAVVGGLGLYAAFFFVLHGWLIGVSVR